MTIAWLLNSIGLFATTIGALLMFLHLHRAARLFEGSAADLQAVYRKQVRSMRVAVALLATWMVLQCLGVIFLP